MGNTTCICPLWGDMNAMPNLLGHNTATALNMKNGPQDSLSMLESGIFHQLQKGKEDTLKAATEMAKRVAATPAMACRRQPHILSHGVEQYATAAVQGKVHEMSA